MRTDTATFRRNAFKAIRAQGVNSVKAKACVDRLVEVGRHHGFPFVDGAEIRISIDSAESQSVAVVAAGLVRLQVSGWQLERHQPLVNCAPTARQVEIGRLLGDMLPDLYAAIGDACDAWEEENGRRPQVDEDWSDRSEFCRVFPAVVAINARYDALKAESLAINPNVDAHLVDPDKASHWYEWHHDLYHYRPSGFRTLAMVEAEMERMKGLPIEEETMREAA